MFSGTSKRNINFTANAMNDKLSPSTSFQDLLSAPSLRPPAYAPTLNPTSAQSASPPSPTLGSSTLTPFAAIALHKTDRLRLMQFSSSEIASLRSVVNASWVPGIQEERIHSTSYEFKLHGNPWSGQGIDSVAARILMMGILSHLFTIGWVLSASTDVSSSVFDKDTMIFRKQSVPELQLRGRCKWMAVSFNQGDRLRLIGRPESELIGAIEELLKDMRLWQSGCWKDVHDGSGGGSGTGKTIWSGLSKRMSGSETRTGGQREAWEFKLNGYPWRPSGEETMSTRMLVIKLLEMLERYGWSLYASVDQNNGPNGNSSGTTGTDSWYCIKMEGWIDGGFIYHR